MELLASFQNGARSSTFRFHFNLKPLYCTCPCNRRAIGACQIGKERVLSAGLSVHIPYNAFVTERPLRLQTPKHLLLDCSLYKEKRKEMQKKLGSSLSLRKLFCIKKGREVLCLFLDKTGIATRKWLITAGSLEGGNSY